MFKEWFKDLFGASGWQCCLLAWIVAWTVAFCGANVALQVYIIIYKLSH